MRISRMMRGVMVLIVAMFIIVTAVSAQQQTENENTEVLSPPKKVVAVADFGNKSGYSGQYDLGHGMAEMLTDALMQSGRFIVLERGALDAVLAEQNLAASGRAAKVGGAKMGNIKRAQILIQGAVTEFTPTSEGGAQSLNIKGFSIGGNSQRAHVAVIVRLFDTTTSEIIASKRVEGSASRGGMDFGVSETDWGFTQSGHKQMPIDKAMQITIDNAVNYVAQAMLKVPWQGKIIKVNQAGEVYINAGSEANIQSGMIFMTFRPGEELIDPDTGMNLGSEDLFVGRMRVATVQPKFCKAQPLDGEPMTGDYVKFPQ